MNITSRAKLLEANLNAKFPYQSHRVYETPSQWVGYMNLGRGCGWRFVALDNDLADISTIGRCYASRRELLAGMAEYLDSSGYGAEPAVPFVDTCQITDSDGETRRLSFQIRVF